MVIGYSGKLLLSGNCAMEDDSTWYENHYIIHDSQEKTLDKTFVFISP